MTTEANPHPAPASGATQSGLAILPYRAPATTLARLLGDTRFRLTLALSILAGLACGFAFGRMTGVKPAIDAGARVDAGTLEQALPWKAEIAADTASRFEIARLLEDVRAIRAQIEQIRHSAETLKAPDRLHALESARDGNAVSVYALEQSFGAMTTRIDALEQRLAHVEKPGVDPTPVGSIGKPALHGLPRRIDGGAKR